MATANDLRKRITEGLLEEIREVQYPSTTMLAGSSRHWIRGV
jgi:hypothetical protein